jgi:hypothetical protein
MARDLNRAPYEAQWRRYRLVQRLTFGLLLGWLPYGALVLTLTGRFGSDALTFGLIAPWALALMISMVCAGNLRVHAAGRSSSESVMLGTGGHPSVCIVGSRSGPGRCDIRSNRAHES